MTLIRLSAIDHVFIYDCGDPSTFVLRFEPGLDLDHLADTFHETARACEGAAGVLVTHGGDCYLDMSRHAAEVEVCAAEEDTPLRECVTLVRTELDAGTPLVRARITRLGGDRGTALSLSLAHSVADAYGTFLFLSAWAARARGETPPQFHSDRTLLTNPAARALPFEVRGERFEHAGFTILERDEPVRRLRWHFEDRLRADLAGKGTGLSYNDALCATLWKEDVARRGKTGDVSFNFLIDFRRFRPELGPLFFGNAVFVATVTRPAQQVLRAPLAEVGQWFRDAVNAAPGQIDAVVSELESAHATLGFDFFRRVRAIYTHAYAVTNLSRLPYEMLSFGGGPPLEFHLGVRPQWCPSCAVLPGRDADHVRIAASVP